MAASANEWPGRADGLQQGNPPAAIGKYHYETYRSHLLPHYNICKFFQVCSINQTEQEITADDLGMRATAPAVALLLSPFTRDPPGAHTLHSSCVLGSSELLQGAAAGSAASNGAC